MQSSHNANQTTEEVRREQIAGMRHLNKRTSAAKKSGFASLSRTPTHGQSINTFKHEGELQSDEAAFTRDIQPLVNEPAPR